MKLYYLQDELNEKLNYIVCCEYEDFSEIHNFYMDCYFDVGKFNTWFLEKYKKTMTHLSMPNVIFKKVS